MGIFVNKAGQKPRQRPRAYILNRYSSALGAGYGCFRDEYNIILLKHRLYIADKNGTQIVRVGNDMGSDRYAGVNVPTRLNGQGLSLVYLQGRVHCVNLSQSYFKNSVRADCRTAFLQLRGVCILNPRRALPLLRLPFGNASTRRRFFRFKIAVHIDASRKTAVHNQMPLYS
jgi:hypothetical protein